jgi:hypothetical protein
VRLPEPRMTALVLSLGLAGLVAACQPGPASAPAGPPPARQTTTSLDLEAARATLAERLIAAGFAVDQDVGGLRVRSTDPRFMRCASLPVRSRDSDSSQRQMARAERTTTTATIRLEQAGARTRVSWQPSFTGSYLNRIENIPFEAPCRSSGVFEQLMSTVLPN